LKYLILLIPFSLIAACKPEPVPTNENFTCTKDQKEINEFSRSLEKQKVPFIVKAIIENKISIDSNGVKTGLPVGSTCIYYSHKYSNIANEINKQVIGEFPPIWGRSVSSGDRNDKLIRKLANNGIKTTVHTYRGTEWVAWPLADVEKVEEILDYEQWKKEYNKELRDEMYRPNQQLKAGETPARDAASGAR